MSYTKGPWRWYWSGNKAVIDSDSGLIVDCDGKGELGMSRSQLYGIENEDDAKLMAAAPQLLEALQALVKCAVKLAENETTDAAAPIWAHIEDANEAIRKAVDIA